MAAPIELRADFDGNGLRRIARASKDGRQVRRLLALAAVYLGGSRSEAARIGGVGLQIMWDWVVRFNERSPDGLIDGRPPARRHYSAQINVTRCSAPSSGPDPGVARHGAVAANRPGAMGLGRI